MSKRRAKAAVALARAEAGDLPVSARVAWGYLAALLAGVTAGVLVLIADQTAAVVLCRSALDDAAADCKLGWAIWVGVAGFLISLIPFALKLKLDWWFLASMWAGIGGWVAFDAIDQWWWWAAAPLLPAVAALLSADWQRGPRLRRAQLAIIVVLMAGAIGSLIWWYLRG
ncbi:hypothetical protein [Propionicimonas sp.]|uniref:hypothetical protein n=1 Tax=Propionicimonas sp. TaxID=1955623 RepID=UPI0018421B26|nr:hypothetical protein [Propionicimonas sp.]MBU3977280.1 hypothetical protein [Actinomycetota bacterium]MBA3021205.1 hypothetical protein [Propionicimonas sp.]MBU3985790.1 hypothetical protein [Actinomycetota bacterium]MBU4008575.1 hypothetical protein [Actinomycetota bacterium]MBU4066275.1 hypothetical protein [Actinomycetota bacterium]